MTTIVADRKLRILAADRQITCSDGAILTTTKISRGVYNEEEVLVATCGDAEAAVAFRLWLEDQEKHRAGQKTDGDNKDIHYPHSNDFHALILFPNGELLWFGSKGYPMIVHERWHGIGSGSSYALGALYAGADMKKALTIAIRLDSMTGKGIQIETFPTRKKRKKRNG